MTDDVAEALHEHELQDAERHGEVMGAIGVLSARFDGLEKSVREVSGRQWDEHPSRAQALPTAPVAAPSAKVIGALITGIVALSTAVSALVSHAVH